MPICSICDDTGLLNSDSSNPTFCYCSAGKQARKQWEATSADEGQGKKTYNGVQAPGFIDVADLEQVNANVDAMRSSLLGTAANEAATNTRHASLQLLYRIAHPGHEITMAESTQLYDLAKALEGFLGNVSSIGRKKR